MGGVVTSAMLWKEASRCSFSSWLKRKGQVPEMCICPNPGSLVPGSWHEYLPRGTGVLREYPREWNRLIGLQLSQRHPHKGQ